MIALNALQILSSQMDLEPAEETGCPKLDPQKPVHSKQPRDFNISQAVLPNGKRMALLKTLLTSACERNCFYCPFRAGRDFRRATLKPFEMAGTFMALQRAGVAEGMFLSSGIAGGSIRTQDQLLATADILRSKMNYRGYLHLKLMPGAEFAQIEQAMHLADRISVNLEAPNDERLHQLAPRKAFLEELLQPLKWAEQIRRNQPGVKGWNGHWPSLTTQFVVGAVGESDLELLSTTAYLYRELRLKRTYFSSFRPIADTPLENLPAENPQRQQRLYQASFLLRDYGYHLEELPFDTQGRLPLDSDPKMAWARNHFREHPLEVNRASREELLRLPGIGPKGATAIMRARRLGGLNSVEDLRKLGVNPGHTIDFILLNGRRPTQQLSLW